MAVVIPVPEGEVARRPLQFFWLADHSGSMSGRKIATLNQAIREALPEVRKAVASRPEVEMQMRAIKFADTAGWHVGPAPVPLESFAWPELSTAGGTATSKAIRVLADELAAEKMPRRGCPPVCVLVSDGCCTDGEAVYDQAIADLLALPWAKKAVRLAIAIGEDADEPELLKFVSHKEIGVLRADTPEQLVAYIKWASTEGTRGASDVKSKPGQGDPGDLGVNVNLTPPPVNPPPMNPGDTW